MGKVKDIKNWSISTPEGWCSFKGVKKTIIPYHFVITFDDDTILKGSENHQVQLINGAFWEISLLLEGDALLGGKIVKSIECKVEPLEVYDILSIDNESSSYNSEGIIHHNCAFIEGVQEIFTSILPTISTGGSIIALSSPNGVGNWFHQMWEDATFGRNRFHPIELKWNVHPERDPKWLETQKANMSSREFAQEYDCDFLGSGNTLIEADTLDFYSNQEISYPIEKRFAGGDFWIWEYPDYTKQYIVSSDVSRGDGSDYSAFHVIEVESCKQVAEYRSQINTREYGHMLVSVANEYNNALLVVENANIGWDVVNTILEKEYRNLYCSPKTHDISLDKFVSKIENEQTVPGFTMSSRTRPLVISKIESYLREKQFTIRSKRLLAELRVFIWQNGKAQAQSGYNDDLIMALGMGLFTRDTALKFMYQGRDMAKAALEGFTQTGYSSIYPTLPNGQSNPYNIQINGQNEDISWLL